MQQPTEPTEPTAAIAQPPQGDAEQPQQGDQPPREAISHPAKLLRIASMFRELLEETRAASMDERGRTRLRQVYERSLEELEGVLSDDLREELASFAQPLDGVPTESEIRVAQAQLVGWLEGLFHGIQAALFAQQQAAMQQLAELRRRGLPAPGPRPPTEGSPGQYL
jgi:Protein of unknown function (DUF2587)